MLAQPNQSWNNKSEKELRNFLNMKNASINPSDHLLYHFNLKQDQLVNGMKKIKDTLDIRYLIKKLLEVEKLKHLLLDED